ncbi:MAG TPA: hypothetical protein PLZ58_03705 [Candidatus Saccharibacteria bacterium]|nr:hypothetical protein [Candidatus Saccharibacteria bacterium]HRQ06820.1 hypothetical protein [Candidatus Saccharibacteria bacterium]
MDKKKVDYVPTNPLAWALGAIVVAGMVTVSVITNAFFRRKKK